MEIYLTILFYLVLAETLRRCCSTLLHTFTGPLSKILGPFLSKFTKTQWVVVLMKGIHLNSFGLLFQNTAMSVLASFSYLNGLEPLMQDCIQMFENALDAECAKTGDVAVIDMVSQLSNLTFVSSYQLILVFATLIVS